MANSDYNTVRVFIEGLRILNNTTDFKGNHHIPVKLLIALKHEGDNNYYVCVSHNTCMTTVATDLSTAK